METKYLISFFFKLKKFNKTIPSHSVLLTGVKATRNDFQQGLEYSGGWKTSCSENVITNIECSERFHLRPSKSYHCILSPYFSTHSKFDNGERFAG